MYFSRKKNSKARSLVPPSGALRLVPIIGDRTELFVGDYSYGLFDTASDALAYAAENKIFRTVPPPQPKKRERQFHVEPDRDGQVKLYVDELLEGYFSTPQEAAKYIKENFKQGRPVSR